MKGSKGIVSTFNPYGKDTQEIKLSRLPTEVQRKVKEDYLSQGYRGQGARGVLIATALSMPLWLLLWYCCHVGG